MIIAPFMCQDLNFFMPKFFKKGAGGGYKGIQLVDIVKTCMGRYANLLFVAYIVVIRLLYILLHFQQPEHAAPVGGMPLGFGGPPGGYYDYPPQATGGYPPQPAGAYGPPPTGGYGPQSVGGYGPQPTGGYGYPPQPQPGYHVCKLLYFREAGS